MKKFILALMVFASVALTSCVTSAYASGEGYYDDEYSNVSIIIRSGTPYYFEGNLLYYFYNGWYYYPYYTNSHYYFYRYSRPLPPPRHGERFIPNRAHRPFYHGKMPRYRSSTMVTVRHRHRNVQPDRMPSIRRDNHQRPNPGVQNRGGGFNHRPAPSINRGNHQMSRPNVGGGHHGSPRGFGRR